MSARDFLGGRVRLLAGDCREMLKALPDNSVDAYVGDPPYALESIRKRFGGDGAAEAKFGTDGAFARASRGFMGKKWDTGEVAFDPEFWREVLRVLKPGAFLVAFSGTRTYHKMAMAIDAAGFEVRDSMLDMLASDTAVGRFLDTLAPAQAEAFFRCIEESEFGGMLAWVYGTGFPKSHDVSKSIDRHLGAEREKKRHKPRPVTSGTMAGSSDTRPWIEASRERGFHEVDGDTAATPEAAQWQGWGTALKPAWEPICLARKPLMVPVEEARDADQPARMRPATVAENVLTHGTGGLNVGACRIDAEKATGWGGKAGGGNTWNESNSGLGKDGEARPVDGRFPANVLHDGSAEVAACFPAEAGASGRVKGTEPSGTGKGDIYGARDRVPGIFHNDSGSAARFFYSAKADGDDRLGSKHPTVKPVDLMRWLVRLVCPKGGTVLDTFAGTGTTGEAAYWEGCNAILCEREEEYQADIAKRMSLVLAGPEEKKRARTEPAPAEALPLFNPDTVDAVTERKRAAAPARA